MAAWKAWTGEALARQKLLPSLGKVMGEGDRAQTDEEMAAALTQWVTQHNAKFALAKARAALEGDD